MNEFTIINRLLQTTHKNILIFLSLEASAQSLLYRLPLPVSRSTALFAYGAQRSAKL